MTVIKFLSEKKLREFIDPEAYDVIDYLLKKVAFSQPESNEKDKNNDIQIPKEFLEQWISQACNLKSIGSGSYPIDVYKENEYGIDAKFISTTLNKKGELTGAMTNETSLGQNFKGAGKYLDQSFEKKEYQKILDGWINLLKDKLSRPLKELNLNKLYYFMFIRGGNKIYLAIAEVDTNSFDNLKVKNSSAKSVFVNNFIKEKYGNVKIYKSKKRMELRLYTKNLKEDNLLITWNFKDLYPLFTDLRGTVKKNNLKKHTKSEFKRFFKN